MCGAEGRCNKADTMGCHVERILIRVTPNSAGATRTPRKGIPPLAGMMRKRQAAGWYVRRGLPRPKLCWRHESPARQYTWQPWHFRPRFINWHMRAMLERDRRKNNVRRERGGINLCTARCHTRLNEFVTLYLKTHSKQKERARTNVNKSQPVYRKPTCM